MPRLEPQVGPMDAHRGCQEWFPGGSFAMGNSKICLSRGHWPTKYIVAVRRAQTRRKIDQYDGQYIYLESC